MSLNSSMLAAYRIMARGTEAPGTRMRAEPTSAKAAIPHLPASPALRPRRPATRGTPPRHKTLWIDGQVAYRTLFPTTQVIGAMLDRHALEVEPDAHPPGGAAAKIPVEDHAQANTAALLSFALIDRMLNGSMLSINRAKASIDG